MYVYFVRLTFYQLNTFISSTVSLRESVVVVLNTNSTDQKLRRVQLHVTTRDVDVLLNDASV